MFNREHSKESIEKIRLAMTGKKKSKETMVKISETLSRKLNRKQNSYRSFLGHILSIYDSIRKYAKQWNLPISSIVDFKQWAINDSTYEELFNTWKESYFNKFDVPVVMRSIKKNGFVIDNLSWKRKGEYSWWGEEYEVLQQVEKNLDNQQKKRNKRDKEWRKKTRKDWEAKRKNK